MWTLGIVLILGYYLSLLVLLGTYAAKVWIWVKKKPVNGVGSDKVTPKTFLLAAGDILFFRRLLSVNDVLWLGEWIFHLSFVLVILGHLRYFLNPVPQWVWALQPFGTVAGYALPFALLYISTVKFLVEKKKYVSSYNFLLLILIFALSISGLLMKTVYHPDIASVKTFVMGMVTFRFGAVPGSALFIFHFALFLALMVNLPTHIFAAPLVLIGARQREETLSRVIHEK
ncbi:MAG TPA: hypothetical protein VEI96_00065 [Thermodesulfovibrionales bacterium]|nr:hypothetical protein [Thermodesulfovibrionales bacterium]